MARLTPTERKNLRASLTPEAVAANPKTCRAFRLLLDERDELEAALKSIEQLTWGGKGEAAVHVIAANILAGNQRCLNCGQWLNPSEGHSPCNPGEYFTDQELTAMGKKR